MTGTGNTPAVATSPGSPPSVEGLRERLPRLEKHAGYVESMTRLPGCKPWLDEHLEDLESVIRALPWLLDRAREAERAEKPAKEKRAPVQDMTGGIPWSLHLKAYDAYAKRYGRQDALIDLEGRGCRGGFSTGELDMFVPGWREELSELTALRRRAEAAEARLSALTARQTATAGWRLVPVEPTGEMLNAGQAAGTGPSVVPSWSMLEDAWAAMLSAAPQQTATAVSREEIAVKALEWIAEEAQREVDQLVDTEKHGGLTEYGQGALTQARKFLTSASDAVLSLLSGGKA